MSGDVRSDGAHIVVDGRATIFGTQLNHIKAELADFRVANPLLQVDGEAQGPMTDVMRFIAESPVDGWIDHVIDNAEVSGNGLLNVRFQMPLGKPLENRIVGQYAFDGNTVKLGGQLPSISQLHGKLTFYGDDVHATGLTADILGGPATVTFAAAEGHTHADANGTLNLSQLRTAISAASACGALVRQHRLETRAGLHGESATWTVDSTLRGAAIDLPLPMAKSPSRCRAAAHRAQDQRRHA